jgi:predicted TIM-barrel fold metal-dependent hydrolase
MTESTIANRAGRGEALTDLDIVDIHAHLGAFPQVHAAFCDAAGIVASMDRVGITRSCISASLALYGDYRAGNDEVAAVLARHPARFSGYGVINPNYPEDVETELTRCLDVLGMWGVKIHPDFHRYPPDGPAYRRLYAAIDGRGGVVLSHTFGEVATIDRLASEFPNVTFIYAHVGGAYDGRLPFRFAPVLDRRENVYVDTVLSVVPFGGIEALAQQIDTSRILFGSDVPFLDNAHQIGRVTHALIDDADKLRILSSNARTLMTRHPAKAPQR